MVGKNRTRGLHVSHARELKLEVDAIGLALDLELRDLVAQLFGRLCVLGGFGNLDLELRDFLVALGDGLFLVGAAHLRLVLRRLLLPEVFLGLRPFLRFCAMVINLHAFCLSLWQTAQGGLHPILTSTRLLSRHKLVISLIILPLRWSLHPFASILFHARSWRGRIKETM